MEWTPESILWVPITVALGLLFLVYVLGAGIKWWQLNKDAEREFNTLYKTLLPEACVSHIEQIIIKRTSAFDKSAEELRDDKMYATLLLNKLKGHREADAKMLLERYEDRLKL